jgi:uncharacterized membrane protein
MLETNMMRCQKMKQWTKEIEVNAPIESVWKLFNSLEDMQKIMLQVIDNKSIKVTDEKVGSVYRQKYKEGKRIEEYDVETLEYVDKLIERGSRLVLRLRKCSKSLLFMK